MSQKLADVLSQVQKAAAKRILVLPHALSQMNAPDRMISTVEIRAVVFDGRVIEDYPGDIRGHSCLLFGIGVEGRPIHVVCAPKDDYLAIITAYIPSPKKWEIDWETRKER